MEEIRVTTKKPPSVKESYFASVGVPVTPDYFLYTCFELEFTYRGLKKKQIAQIDKLRWPELMGEHDFAGKDISSLLSELFSWYEKTYPELAQDRVLDYVVASEILQSFVILAMDVLATIQETCKLRAPFLTELTATPEGSGSHDNVEGLKVWQIVTDLIKKHFSAHESHMLAYFRWCFHRQRPKLPDLASLPPVGRFLPLLYRSQRNRQDGRRGPPSRYSQQGSQGSGSSNQRFAGKRPGSDRNDQRGEQSQRPLRPVSGNSDNKGSSGKFASKNRRGEEVAASDDKEAMNRKTALLEVKRGCKELHDNPSQKSFLLAPQNSYIRRLQHQLVGENGFESVSEGEGASRAIKIVRQ